MDLVIDANILFAALIRNGATRRLLLMRTPNQLSLYTTPLALEEIAKYSDYLAGKTSLTKERLAGMIAKLVTLAGVRFVEKDEFRAFISEGERISPDIKDVQYFSIALYKKCAIWSNERRLKEQKRVEVITTEELLDILE